ncbi:MAG TPA: hypothetical protein VKT81_00615 [Bryobacteraceae bacterium]|nr:hypothetical protein [Bryobacteraceae bacterium]
MREASICALLGVFLAPICVEAAGGLSFEPNLGQTGSDVRYIARTSGGVVFVTEHGIVLSAGNAAIPALELAGANPQSQWTPEAENGEIISYFVGRDPSKWTQNIPRYQRLVRPNVYPGIDLVLYGAEGQLEYDFRLQPNANPDRIRLKPTDAASISIAPDGSLVVEHPAGQIRHRKPIFREALRDGSSRILGGRFQITDAGEIGFLVADRDPALPLSIDPILESSTYFGGHGDDQVIATDGANVLVGNTTSIDLPGTPFARRKGTNLFVKTGKFTFIFGCAGDLVATSAVFSNSQALSVAVGGYTDCTDLATNLSYYGTLLPSLQPTYGGGSSDGFLLTIAGLYQPYGIPNFGFSYIGGPGDDRVNALAYSSWLVIAGSTTAGGLPEPAFVAPSIQPQLAGGMDAFVMLAVPMKYLSLTLYSTTYLGGSGDDTALAAATMGDDVYIAGETKSPNFPVTPGMQSARRGDSDAFVAHITNSGATLAGSTLFGGSDSDSATAMALLPNGNVVIAGVTSSPDLKLKNPTQPKYGGGVSDPFVAQFTPDLATLVSSTFIGGSDADQATSVAAGYPNTIFVGGWTASQNFPTVNALQPKYGGGAGDGFLVHFDDDGSIYQATYFGGSGSDHVLGLTSNYYPNFNSYYGPAVWLTGTTSSPDLPLKNAEQATLSGSANGFVAEITADIFNIAPFTLAKDLSSPVNLYPGGLSLSAGIAFTAESSNPSIVPVSANASSAGAASATFYVNNNSGAATFYADCLADTGGATLTISAPGYKTKSVVVHCLTPAISIQSVNGSPLQTNVAAPPSYVGINLVPNDPHNIAINPGTFPRPGAPPITVQISNSNPNAGSISADLITAPSSIFFAPLAVGSTELAFSAGNISILHSNTLPVNVAGSYTFPGPFIIPAGFQVPASLVRVNPNLTASFPSITSSDPLRILLSLDATKPGSASIKLSSPNQLFWLQAVGSSGSAQIIFQVPGEPDVHSSASITSPVSVLTYGQNTGQPIQLAVGAASAVGFVIQGAAPGSANQVYLNPKAAALTFTLQSTNTSVVGIPPASAQVAPGAYAVGQFQFTGLMLGTAILTLANSAKIPPGPPGKSATVHVVSLTSGSVVFPDVEVGKDLVAPMSITLPAPAKSDVLIHVSINNPALALLSLDGTSNGTAEITSIIPGGQSSTRFYVYGLAASAQAQVSAVFTGYGTVTANINLDRTGFYWANTTDSISVGTGSSEQILVGPLDSATAIPIGVQPFRPGAKGSFTIVSSNLKIVAVTGTSNTFPISTSTINVSGAAAGTATLTIQQPAGFTAPSARQQMRITVAPAAQNAPAIFSFDPFLKYTQPGLSFQGYADKTTLTVTSSDPSKVLLSSDVTKLGSRSITVTGQPVFAQILAGSGTVTISVSAKNYPNISATFSLSPIGLGISVNSSAASYQNGVYTTTSQSPALNVLVGLYSAPNRPIYSSLVPGLSPIQANITSSNQNVAIVGGSPVTIPLSAPSPGNPPAATLLPVGVGQSTISISQPPGFASVGLDQFTLQVNGPALVVNGFVAAKDTMNTTNVSLGSGVKAPSVNLPVTITSSDPSRILLSPDATTPPTASITASMPAGRSSVDFYVHALSDNGNVPIQVAAAGFSSTSFAVKLFPLAFQFLQISPLNVFVQSGTQLVGVGAFALAPAGQGSQTAYSIRPGVPPIVVGVTSSDPSIVSVSPKLTFQGSQIPQSLSFTPQKAGSATLSLKVPSGYQTAPGQAQMTIDVTQAGFVFNFGTTSVQLGKDLQESVTFSATADVSHTPVTVTSSDPSLALVSLDPGIAGQRSVTITNSSVNFLTVNVQGLTASGHATLSIAAPGFQSATLPITLTPAGAIFQDQNSPELSVLTSSGVLQEGIYLASLDPVTLQPGQAGTSRPGANLSVTATSSDPKVLKITTPTIQVPHPGATIPGIYAEVQPVAAGTAVLSLGPLAGNPLPASGNHLVFNVTAPELSIPLVTLGSDLETPVQLTVASSAVNKSADMQIPITAQYPILLSLTPTDAGQNAITVVVPAGHTSSKPFYVQAVGGNSGVLTYGGGSFSSYTTAVTVTPTAFVIQEAAKAKSIAISKGATAQLTAVPVLSPPSVIPSGPLSIRPGVNPIVVAVASTNPSVATTNPSQVTFNGGDQKQTFGVQGVAAGTATVKLLGVTYDFGQPQASVQVVVK